MILDKFTKKANKYLTDKDNELIELCKDANKKANLDNNRKKFKKLISLFDVGIGLGLILRLSIDWYYGFNTPILTAKILTVIIIGCIILKLIFSQLNKATYYIETVGETNAKQ